MILDNRCQYVDHLGRQRVGASPPVGKNRGSASPSQECVFIGVVHFPGIACYRVPIDAPVSVCIHVCVSLLTSLL